MPQVKRVAKKNYTSFRPLILSRHPSHGALRARTKNVELLPFRSVIRFGSTTEVSTTDYPVQINSVQSIRNSASKRLMKECFIKHNIATPMMWNGKDPLVNWAEGKYPIVAKAYFGSRGKGNTLINNREELDNWMKGRTLNGYIFEVYVNFAYEYRLHITADGCFYACRKALKKGVDEKEKWHRHDSTCVWLLETNPNFLKPTNWNEIVSECVKALGAIGADLLCFDVRVQASKDHNGRQEFVIIECNSAPSMDNGTGELSFCAKSYINEIPKLLRRKRNG